MGDVFPRTVAVGIYKRSQGRSHPAGDVRRAVAVAIWPYWRLLAAVSDDLLRRLWVASVCRVTRLPGLRVAGWLPVWSSYRLVNVPAFADFLIAVEAEMNKVSWPTRTELFRGSMVVLIMIFVLGGRAVPSFDFFVEVLLFRRVLQIL